MQVIIFADAYMGSWDRASSMDGRDAEMTIGSGAIVE